MLSRSCIAQLHPVLNGLDDPVESASEYARRVQEVLPNFPSLVIIQWFYDHHNCIEQYAWLDCSSLTFELTMVRADVLNTPCQSGNETVVQYRDYYLQGMDIPRIKRLAEHVEESGTWPVPPIILENEGDNIESPWRLRYSAPYELLEGHHRMAALYALGKHRHGSDEVWLLQRSSAPIKIVRK